MQSRGIDPGDDCAMVAAMIIVPRMQPGRTSRVFRMMRVILGILVAGLSVVPGALAEEPKAAGVPYSKLAPWMPFLEKKEIDGRNCSQFLFFSEDKAPIDLAKGGFRMKTADGKIIPIHAEALPKPVEVYESICTHALWVPCDAAKYKDAVLLQDLEGSVHIRGKSNFTGGDLAAATGLSPAALRALNSASEDVETFRNIFGANHAETRRAKLNFVTGLSANSLDGVAEPMARDLFDALEKENGIEHPDTVHALANLARIVAKLDRADEAETLYRRLLPAVEKVHGEGHKKAFDTNVLLADLLKKQNKRDEAEALYRRVIDAQFKGGNSEVYVLYSKAQIATLLAQSGKKEEALAMAREVVDRYRAYPDATADPFVIAKKVLDAEKK